MQPTRSHRVLLVVAGLVAVAVGASILVAPAAFHATHGIEISTDASLLSEIRAPGGALLALGAVVFAGAFRRTLTLASTWVAAALYLGYGGSRGIAIALDGVPDDALVGAAAIELVIGALCALTLVFRRGAGVGAPSTGAASVTLPRP
ncbi:MAG: DUF4345 domain-containing protein [Planctomycetota bacterium]